MNMNQGESVIENRLITGRPTLTVDEAIELGKCTIADLFYQAEIGKLVIYVIADGWNAGRIYEIDHSIDISSGHPTLSFRGPELPELLSATDANFLERHQEIFRLSEYRDQVFGNVVDYGRRTAFRDVFSWSLTDQQPIAAHTFREYRINPEKAAIELDLNRILGSKDTIHERFVCPEPRVLLQDSLVSGKLVVMTADLQKILGQSPDDNLSEMFSHPYWPEQLGMAIGAWQHARDSFQPGQNPKEIMEKWLGNRKLYGKPIGSEAVERITTIANWQKKGGRRKVLEG
jgi:hypothetical protein